MDGKLEIVCEDLAGHPHCPHGPTLLFSRSDQNDERKLFYACSACRQRKDCSVYISKTDYDLTNKKPKKFYARDDEYVSAVDLRLMIHSKKPLKRRYCHDCNVPFKKRNVDSHTGHDILHGISDDDLRAPTIFLRPMHNDKVQAQYFFSQKTLQVFGQMFQKLGFSKVICMGAPRLHEYLNANFKQLNIESFLLDIDHRFLYFYGDESFAWFNMFNNHFFAGNRQLEQFENFLKAETNTKTLLFTDPPFGCRTEPLIQTIKEISTKYQRLNLTNQILPVFWIFPYYMEFYIKNIMSEMEMCDFKIDYTNHELYSDGEHGRKHGSPVRIFTNIPLNLIELQAGYKFCSKCKRWVAVENNHCMICRECPSKNGEMYRHCKLCATCVKPNYKHCGNCGRCAQKFNHSCQEYSAKLNCWICRKHGHSEMNCESFIDACRKGLIKKSSPNFNTNGKKRTCKICCMTGHNEKNCGKREEILQEFTFLGKITNILN